jgi:hypothetical protein
MCWVMMGIYTNLKDSEMNKLLIETLIGLWVTEKVCKNDKTNIYTMLF